MFTNLVKMFTNLIRSLNDVEIFRRRNIDVEIFLRFSTLFDVEISTPFWPFNRQYQLGKQISQRWCGQIAIRMLHQNGNLNVLKNNKFTWKWVAISWIHNIIINYACNINMPTFFRLYVLESCMWKSIEIGSFPNL